MELSDAVTAALDEYCAEWNRAEKAIKLAEQVNGEIVNPAIYELRYGGRRFVEAFDHLKIEDDPAAIKVLRDAHFDCMRSRHDAIDAATSKMVSDLTIATKKLGVNSVLAACPDFPSLLGDLGSVRDMIATSRENRDNRDAIYASIEHDNLGELVKRFRAFQASDGVMRAHAKDERCERLFLRITTAVAILVAIAAWIWPRA